MIKNVYSTQERITNLLKVKSGNNIIELPNIIFYKKNENNWIYSKMDRNIIVKQDIEVKNFLVYLKVKVFHEDNKKMDIIEIPKGEILSLKKNSCYFIEIKSSIYSLFEKDEYGNLINKDKENLEDNKSDNKNNKSPKNNKNINEIKDIKTQLDLSSNHSNVAYILKKKL